MELEMHIEIKVEVHADYQPYEPETLETPAVEADIDNITVYLGGVDLTDSITKEQLERIKSQLWEQLDKEIQEHH